jgi:hypothetical protein
MVAATGAAIVPSSLISDGVRQLLVAPVTLIAVAITAVLFLRMVFDAKIRSGIDAANLELRGDKPWPGNFLPKPLNREWGLFGTRMGDRPLQLIRVVCFGEFLLALVVSRHDRPDLLFLAAASFSLTIMLTIIHVGLNTEAQRR